LPLEREIGFPIGLGKKNLDISPKDAQFSNGFNHPLY